MVNEKTTTFFLKLVSIIYFWVILTSCVKIDCNKIPEEFVQYESGIKFVKTSSFQITDKIKTPSSSWIIGAQFYSCDNTVGFLVIVTQKKEYLHQGVPVEVWQNFKNANSYGEFYNKFLKGKFKLKMASK